MGETFCGRFFVDGGVSKTLLADGVANLSGKLMVLEFLGSPSFLERGVPSLVRRKPTRLAADFIHALLLSALLDFVGGTGVLLVVATDCKEEEKVGVMKCGDLDFSEFSFSPDFFDEFGESRG